MIHPYRAQAYVPDYSAPRAKRSRLRRVKRRTQVWLGRSHALHTFLAAGLLSTWAATEILGFVGLIVEYQIWTGALIIWWLALFTFVGGCIAWLILAIGWPALVCTCAQRVHQKRHWRVRNFA